MSTRILASKHQLNIISCSIFQSTKSICFEITEKKELSVQSFFNRKFIKLSWNFYCCFIFWRKKNIQSIRWLRKQHEKSTLPFLKLWSKILRLERKKVIVTCVFWEAFDKHGCEQNIFCSKTRKLSGVTRSHSIQEKQQQTCSYMKMKLRICFLRMHWQFWRNKSQLLFERPPPGEKLHLNPLNEMGYSFANILQ